MGLEPGHMAGASLAINSVLFNETCELGTGADVCGISESAAQVE